VQQRGNRKRLDVICFDSQTHFKKENKKIIRLEFNNIIKSETKITNKKNITIMDHVKKIARRAIFFK
jgi:hypothetical protein